MEKQHKDTLPDQEEFQYGNAVDLRAILENAIKMQALYSDGKIKFVETSSSVQ